MARRLTRATSLDTLRKEARRWLRALREDAPGARLRLDRVHPAAPASPTLRDVQHALAREYGHESWTTLKRVLAAAQTMASPEPEPTAAEYNGAANDLMLAFNSRDESALARLNARRGLSFTFDDLAAVIWRSVYAFRQRSFKSQANYLLPDEARLLVAQDAGYASWAALTGLGATRPARVPAYAIDEQEKRIAPRRLLTASEWHELIDTMKQRGLTSLDANGQMTDAVLAHVASLDHVTTLDLSGSRQLTDDGLRHLSRMPQLQQLRLNEYPGGRLTDRGLEVLRQLSALHTFEMTWQRGITDAGVRHLAACEHLERVDVMGTPTGNGLIEALQGKRRLCELKTGRMVTDAGLARLAGIPRLHQRHQPSGSPEAHVNPVRLLVDGPFTDAGFAHVAALEGVMDFDLFWHVTGITSDAFAHLAELPNLFSLGADGRLSDDLAMAHIAAIPRLRKLRAQESVASDEGFEKLSRSRSLESFWGRECPNFGSRGFLAFSQMPALRGMGVSCKNVDDEALARWPDFPALRELTPIGVKDKHFRHIGRCERLERLTCMYCRDTTDVATEHIAGLALKYYYAGLTLITDRSLEILGRMTSLEQIELYECNGITDAGLVPLAALPRLREVALDSLPGVTLEGTRVFPAGVRVRYTT